MEGIGAANDPLHTGGARFLQSDDARVLRPKELLPDSLQEKEQQPAPANCIVAIAEDGVKDPDELRKKAIDLMLIGPASGRATVLEQTNLQIGV